MGVVSSSVLKGIISDVIQFVWKSIIHMYCVKPE